MKPVVAIVGRPNVGKSTLFNRLVGERKALVDDFPGVTRDRHYADASYGGRDFIVIDTGGYDPEASGDMLALMREQARIAMEESDVILFLMDGKEGLSPTDELIAAELRQAPRPVFHVVNKLETRAREAEAYEFYQLGVDELHFISAAHGQGVYDLMDQVIAQFPEAGPEDEDELDADEIRIAVVGRPNVGKSTIVNKLLGEERLLASDMPGTTRDAIDTVLEHEGKRYRVIDTAGIRRKRAISERLENYSVIKSFKSIDRAHVSLILFDATEPFVEQEARLAGMVADKGRAAIPIVNKWDLISKDSATAGAYVKKLREHLKFMPWAPVLFVSAKTGLRVGKVLGLVDKVLVNYNRRIGTGALNRLLKGALERHQLPIHKSKRVKLYYMSQVSVRPPTFVAFANYPDSVHFSYQRYLINTLREEHDFEGTPIRLKFKARSTKRRKQAEQPLTPEEAIAKADAEAAVAENADAAEE